MMMMANNGGRGRTGKGEGGGGGEVFDLGRTDGGCGGGGGDGAVRLIAPGPALRRRGMVVRVCIHSAGCRRQARRPSSAWNSATPRCCSAMLSESEAWTQEKFTIYLPHVSRKHVSSILAD